MSPHTETAGTEPSDSSTVRMRKKAKGLRSEEYREAEEPPAASVNNLELRFGCLPGYTSTLGKRQGQFLSDANGALTRPGWFDKIRSNGWASSDNVDRFGLVVAQCPRRVHVCPVPFVVVS